MVLDNSPKYDALFDLIYRLIEIGFQGQVPAKDVEKELISIEKDLEVALINREMKKPEFNRLMELISFGVTEIFKRDLKKHPERGKIFDV